MSQHVPDTPRKGKRVPELGDLGYVLRLESFSSLVLWQEATVSVNFPVYQGLRVGLQVCVTACSTASSTQAPAHCLPWRWIIPSGKEQLARGAAWMPSILCRASPARRSFVASA